MHMIGEPYEEADPDLVVALLGPGEGPDDDLVQHGTGTEQEAAVEGTAGDLDQGSSFWDETDSSAHHPQKTENRSRNLFVLEPLGFARGVNEPFRYFRTGGRWSTCPHPGFSEGLQGASLRHPVRRSLPGRREERELPRPPAAGGPTVELGKKDEGAGIGDPETNSARSRAARSSAWLCSSRRLIAATPIRSSSRRKVIRFMPAKRAAFPEDRRPIS